MFKFILEHQDKNSGARAGRIVTARGEIETPIFMPVGTVGAVKALSTEDLETLKAQIILGNTYHLYVRPGLDVIEKAGGLHKFMAWDRPILTDSGGYQVFSLQENRKITKDGVTFRSHIDGDTLTFNAESVMAAERTIGADIIMPFDDCPPYPCERKDMEKAMKHTHEWLDRAIKDHKEHGTKQALFGIAQGGCFDDLRLESAARVAESDTAGFAVGGLSVGEPMPEMYRILDALKPVLPLKKPRYLMGVGMPENIVEAVDRGFDMFDCIVPTRHARNGQVFTSKGRVHYKAGQYREAADRPLDPHCRCFVCRRYSISYLRHLFNCGEITVMRLATYHNVYFYLNMMRKMREAILRDAFAEWKTGFLAGLEGKGG